MLLAAVLLAQTAQVKPSDDLGVLTTVVDAFYNSSYRDLEHWRRGKYVVIAPEYSDKTRSTFSAKLKTMTENPWNAVPSETRLLKSFVSPGRQKVTYKPETLVVSEKLGLDARVKMMESWKEEDPSNVLIEGTPYKDLSGQTWTPRAILSVDPVTYSPEGKHAIAFVRAMRWGRHWSFLRFLVTRSGSKWKIVMIQAVHID